MPNSDALQKLRVVQWGTGVSGIRALKAAIDHPAMDLVGLWVHSPAKVGRDAGDLADRGHTGVIATCTCPTAATWTNSAGFWPLARTS